MKFSSKMEKIKPSATLTVNAKAAELKAQGKEVISLAAGQPDLSPPQSIIEGVKKAIEEGATRYTPVAGIPELLEAIGGYYKKFYNVEISSDMVVTTNGGKQGLYNIFQALLDPEDEVLIPAPYWVSYPDMVYLSYGKPVIVPTEPQNNFLVTPDLLEKYITPKTKILVLNTPSNPTGCHYSQDRFDEIVKWAIDKGLFIISDEIYDQLVYPPATPTSIAKWLKEYPENIAIVNGLSKSFAIPGWRMGYVIADPKLIKTIVKIQGQSTSNICSLVQMAALYGLKGPLEFLEENRKIFMKRRDLALEIISTWKNVICPKPDGAFYLFPKVDFYYKKDIKNSTDLCAYLLEEAKVAAVPGAAFGDDRCIRLSYAIDENSLEKALNKIKEALEKLL